MVFAKTEQAKATLQSGWSRVEKKYQAVVEGRMPSEQGVLESELDESQPLRVYSGPRTARTRHALTRYQVLKHTEGRSLVELTLETGRRHQIRVQLAEVGCPIVGDAKYGARTDPVRRLALHASLLRLPHPATGEERVFRSPLPGELRRLVGGGV
jgi:23S rRNA pseudouridine1911/1915/1917 synthase